MSKNNAGKPLKEDVWRPLIKELGDVWKELDGKEFPQFVGSGGPLNPVWYMAAFKWLSRSMVKKGKGRNYR